MCVYIAQFNNKGAVARNVMQQPPLNFWRENTILHRGMFSGGVKGWLTMIINNTATMMTLGELNKNITRAGKNLARLASGERITNAGDDASGYAISERMRVRIRALDQDEANVQNGTALLRVAEGAIQNQIELMKTIKEKVIDADNDTNTDIDRQTLQKEINQCYQEIEDIAQETNYNGIRLLVGDRVEEKVLSWVVKSNSSLLEGSDAMNMINVIPDTYPTLNGITGPFDLFTRSEVKHTEDDIIERLGFSPLIQFEGGADNIYTIDSSFDTVASLDGIAFSVGSETYVLTTNPGRADRYNGTISDYIINLPRGVNEIDISGCNSVQEVLANIQAESAFVTGSGVDDNGDSYLISTQEIRGVRYREYNATVNAVAPTGLFGEENFSGGRPASGIIDDDPDTPPPQPATYATFQLSGVTENTGITIYPNSNTVQMVQFVSGDNAPSSSNPPNGVLSVGVDYTGDFQCGWFTVSMSNRNITLTASVLGERGNEYLVRDGIADATYEFLRAEPLVGENSKKYAYATIDVSAYNNVEDLIENLKGKTIMTGNINVPIKDDYSRDYVGNGNYGGIEFVDSASDNPLDRMSKINTAEVWDLNVLRNYAEEGETIGKAFSKFAFDQASTYMREAKLQEAHDSNDQTIGIKIRADRYGAVGNDYTLFLVQGQLRSYTLDYGQWFDENPDVSIPDFLNNKGFRAYCASCDNQVFNFHFITEDLPSGGRPDSDPDGEDIKHIYIDVSNVTDAASLVQAIYDQAMPKLTGDDPDLNHFMRLAVDDEKLIIYDERRLTDDFLRYGRDGSGNLLYEYQWDDNYQVGGAKIADGVWDNVEVGERNIYVKDLVIQHTDHASQNIHLQIPQTTMDHLFGYQAGTKDWDDFNVMTTKGREALLGNSAGRSRSGKYLAEEDEGLLDYALNYLIGANCLVGAQNMRLKMTEANIVTQRESTTASESTIGDADMAKEMTAYTRNNVLAQAAQSMLAQANQNHAGVLNLLQ